MKMTNILTWDTKPIQLPKINSNLLSVISIILLFMMAFLTVSAIASHCEQIKKDLRLAVAAEVVVVGILYGARMVLKAAGATGNPWAIGAAMAGVVAAYAAVIAIGIIITNLTVKLIECEKEHGSENYDGADGHAAGGCNSGSCGSG